MHSTLDRHIEAVRAGDAHEKAIAVDAAWNTYFEILARRDNPDFGDASACVDAMATAGITDETHRQNERILHDAARLKANLRTPDEIQQVADATRLAVEEGRRKISEAIGRWFARMDLNDIAGAIRTLDGRLQHCTSGAEGVEALQAIEEVESAVASRASFIHNDGAARSQLDLMRRNNPRLFPE